MRLDFAFSTSYLRNISALYYVELHAAYGKRLRNAEESIRAIQKEMDNELEKADKANTWLDYFVKYQDIEELSRTVVVELIRQIRVYLYVKA